MNKWLRIELHNHTTESDGQLTIPELLDFMLANGIPAFAMTDHNTVSGHAKMRTLIESRQAPVELVNGLEFTTFFGHILCFGMNACFSWHNLNPDAADAWFARIRACGAQVGIAHPDAVNHTRWQMTLKDWSLVDFIEVVNNSHATTPVNLPAIRRWESLVLNGFRIAATTGLDLHRTRSLQHVMQTQIPFEPGVDAGVLLSRAIAAQRTMITCGPDFEATRVDGGLLIEADWHGTPRHEHLTVTCTTRQGVTETAWPHPESPLLLPNARETCVIKLHGLRSHVSDHSHTEARTSGAGDPSSDIPSGDNPSVGIPAVGIPGVGSPAESGSLQDCKKRRILAIAPPLFA